jgi:hypothetical protein
MSSSKMMNTGRAMSMFCFARSLYKLLAGRCVPHHLHTPTQPLCLLAQMKDIIQWCLDLGVKVVSVYAFSIDNFKRPPDEVHDLMELATAKFEELMNVSVRS